MSAPRTCGPRHPVMGLVGGGCHAKEGAGNGEITLVLCVRTEVPVSSIHLFSFVPVRVKGGTQRGCAWREFWQDEVKRRPRGGSSPLY